jgi:hypothetical protein
MTNTNITIDRLGLTELLGEARTLATLDVSKWSSRRL